MIVLTKSENKVVDVVKSAKIVSNGLEVVRLNDGKLVYGQGTTFTQTEIAELPANIDTTKLANYNFVEGDFILTKKEYTKTDFFDLFTGSELRAFDKLAETDDKIYKFKKLLDGFNEVSGLINIKDIRIVEGISGLYQLGVLTEDRKNEMLGE